MFLKSLLISLFTVALTLPFVIACEDDSDFQWSYNYQGTKYTKGCYFLRPNNANERAKRVNNWCGKSVSYKGKQVLVKNKCKLACDNCDGGDDDDRNNDDSCKNTPVNWKDTQNKGCGWYEIGDRCEKFKNRWNNGKNAKNACCTCGGGNKPDNDDSCKDVPGWHEGGNNGYQYDCAWYGQAANKRCSQFGDKNPYNYKTANQACCVCKNRSSVAVEGSEEELREE